MTYRPCSAIVFKSMSEEEERKEEEKNGVGERGRIDEVALGKECHPPDTLPTMTSKAWSSTSVNKKQKSHKGAMGHLENAASIHRCNSR